MKYNDISLLPISVLVVLLISASSTNLSSTASSGLVYAAPHAKPSPAVVVFMKDIGEVVDPRSSDFDEKESAAFTRPSLAAPTGRKHMKRHEEHVAEVVDDGESAAAPTRPSLAAPTGRRHMKSHEERVAEVVVVV